MFCLVNSAGLASTAFGGGLKSNQASKRNAGSAARLSGSCVIYSIFVSDRLSRWREDQEREVHAKLGDAVEFIERESRRYGIDSSFQLAPPERYSVPFRLPTQTFSDPRWTETVIEGQSGMSGASLVDHLRSLYQVDNVALCLHANKSALSYNLAYYDNVSDTYFAERMICFTRYPDRRETATATYAHEVLHLFGAGDLYFPYDRVDRRKDEAKRIFPNDIMLRVDYDMSRLTVGPFTAYRVGWTDRLRPAFHLFED